VPERTAARPAAAAPALGVNTGPAPERPVVQPAEVEAAEVTATDPGEPAEGPAGGRAAVSAGPQVAPAPAAAAATADPRGAMPLAAPEVSMVAHEAARPAWRLAAKAAGAVRAEPAPPQALAGQITLAIGRASDHRVEIRLDPPELGRVQIQLNPGDGGLQAIVLAERPETQDLLRRHAETLARDLNAAGYTNVSLDFAAGGEAAPRRDEPETGGAPAPAAVEIAVAPARAPADGLDIRL
jgi:flagellar hook-length control protein FliK